MAAEEPAPPTATGCRPAAPVAASAGGTAFRCGTLPWLHGLVLKYVLTRAGCVQITRVVWPQAPCATASHLSASRTVWAERLQAGIHNCQHAPANPSLCYQVTPGSPYTVVVGAGGALSTAGGDSYFISATTVKGGGGAGGTGGANGATGGSFFPPNQGGSGGNAQNLDSSTG